MPSISYSGRPDFFVFFLWIEGENPSMPFAIRPRVDNLNQTATGFGQFPILDDSIDGPRFPGNGQNVSRWHVTRVLTASPH